jgi:hypothetical protein
VACRAIWTLNYNIAIRAPKNRTPCPDGRPSDSSHVAGLRRATPANPLHGGDSGSSDGSVVLESSHAHLSWHRPRAAAVDNVDRLLRMWSNDEQLAVVRIENRTQRHSNPCNTKVTHRVNVRTRVRRKFIRAHTERTMSLKQGHEVRERLWNQATPQ